MISLTRLNGEGIILNADLIKMIEATPDTIVTLINGEHILVREDVQEVVKRAVQYARSVRAFAP